MTPWTYPLLASALLYGGAAMVAPTPERGVAAVARHVTRPLLLPFLWSGLSDAVRRGNVGETVTRGRTLMRLLPGWIDGHIHFAGLLAFDPTARPDEAVDRLIAAGALLEEAARQTPARSDELLIAMAFFLEMRTRERPELTAQFRDRLGRGPLEAAAGYLARATALSTRLEVRAKQAYLTKRMVGPPLRSGDLPRALATLDLALGRLQEVGAALAAAGNSAGADNATAHRKSLERLREHLRGGGAAVPDRLKQDPFLDDIFGGR